MQQLKIIPQKEQKSEQIMTGQVCPLPRRGGIGSAKGAMGSAIVTIIL